MLVATFGNIPRFFWFFFPFVSSSSSPVPSPLPILALLASPETKQCHQARAIVGEMKRTQADWPSQRSWFALSWLHKPYWCVRARKSRLRPQGICRADYATPFYQQNLALISPTSGGRSVGVVRSRIQATEFLLVFPFLLACPLVFGDRDQLFLLDST
jgi:hypothetical protein